MKYIFDKEAFEILSETSGMSIDDVKSMEEWQFVCSWNRWIGDNSFDGYLEEMIESLLEENEKLTWELEGKE